MRKVVAAINMTLDGFCDHTAISPDEEIHEHYSELLNSADMLLYGRITYQLMQYWRPFVENPSGDKSMDEFAVTMANIPKIVFSNSLKSVEWNTAKLAKNDIAEEVLELRQSGNGGSKDILVGSPSLIVALTNLNLINEFQLCVHPIILGNGAKLLWKNITDKVNLNLLKTKTFRCGAIILYYEPTLK